MRSRNVFNPDVLSFGPLNFRENCTETKVHLRDLRQIHDHGFDVDILAIKLNHIRC